MRACVIGCGVSGLPAIKECRAAGIEVVAYERTSQIGGLWNYRPQMKEGATVMKSTVVNTSKEMMAYSDFPPPAEYPNFMHNSLVLEYIRDYANKFDLLKDIRFNTNVEKLERVGDKWEVTTTDGTKEQFDFAMLCTGHHAFPQYPDIKGIEKFKGRVLHSHQYRDYEGFQDKNVFIVGIGNSSLDVAVELSNVAKSVTISTRRGTWLFNRVWTSGMPYDIYLLTRWYTFLIDHLPWTLCNEYVEYRLQQRLDHDTYGLRPYHRFFQQHPTLNDTLPNLLSTGQVVITQRLDHDTYGLRPYHRFFQQHPTLNDTLPNLLSTGQVVITEDVDHVEESEVIVKGGRRFQADVIIYATGYTFKFPYLTPQSIIPIVEHEVNLYKYVFPPDCTSLAVIGLIQPIGSLAPISELQSRWVTAVWAGQIKLPSEKGMIADIEHTREIRMKRYFKSTKHTLQVDYMKYMDEVADLIGCKPNLWKYALTDPKFAFRLFMGANAPYAYRLQGIGSWEGAKEALNTLPERVKKPMKNRDCRMRKYKRRGAIDHYFHYISLKWLAGWTTLLLCAGLWLFCTGTSGMSPISYSIYVIVFFCLFSSMLLWFETQFNCATIF
ncbi:Dimethylaniline monooxygenase [N-oxide-forming] 5 [Toxocara canis]|uniref:Flavin-containing monooxygenase n=1 Tax=Toxocara canis TaxID=6265 RepID=A0A0B2W1D5_TOXCA|nr:Dimethylaniline monooxygenase [N-oxide-forming] 5 [Toxocara canis]